MTQQERSTRTRRRIVAAAGEVFAEKGFNGATIADVYKRVDLTKGAFYYYFSSKEDLAQAVLESQVDSGGEFPLIPRSTRVQEMVDAGMVFAHAIRADPLLQGSLRLSLERGAKDVNRRQPYEAWLTHNRVALIRAKECGELFPHVDPDTLAHLFVGSFSGIQVLSEVLTDWADLEDRTSVLLQHIMSMIALPAVLAQLDMAPGRSAKVLAELGASDPGSGWCSGVP